VGTGQIARLLVALRLGEFLSQPDDDLFKYRGAAMKNVVRGVLALALTALATWLASEIANAIFGPDEELT